VSRRYAFIADRERPERGAYSQLLVVPVGFWGFSPTGRFTGISSIDDTAAAVSNFHFLAARRRQRACAGDACSGAAAARISRSVELAPVFWEHEVLKATDTFQSQIPRAGEADLCVFIL
jgi:hypothetical protein